MELPVTDVEAARTLEAVRRQITPSTIAHAEIHSSPSLRCLEFAEALALPRKPRVAEQLLEMSFGAWEGKCWDSIERRELDAWAADVWGYRPGGGESADMVAARWNCWFQGVHAAANDVVAITHAGVIRVALALAGGAPGSSLLDAKIPFGSVWRITNG
jgi:alpha-ribazole phosphatase